MISTMMLFSIVLVMNAWAEYIPLQKGSTGDQVIDIQNALKDQGLFVAESGGDYDTDTQNAVLAFQVINGMTPTGIVDAETYEALLGKAPDDGDMFEDLTVGSSGDRVLEVQDALLAKGFLSAIPNGEYDIPTRNAVIAFQVSLGMAPTGDVDQATYEALLSAGEEESGEENTLEEDTGEGMTEAGQGKEESPSDPSTEATAGMRISDIPGIFSDLEDEAGKAQKDLPSDGIQSSSPGEKKTGNSVSVSRGAGDLPPDGAFEIVNDEIAYLSYSYENSINNTIRFLVVENLTENSIQVSSSSTAMDASGNPIGVNNSELDVLGPGCISVMMEYYSDLRITDIASFETAFKVEEESYYSSILEDLTAEINNSGETVVVTLHNGGDVSAEFVEAYCLFFRGDQIVYSDSAYFTDDDYELKSGAAITKQLSSYEDYDCVQVFFTGRRTKNSSTTKAEDIVSYADQVEYQPLSYKNSLDDVMHCVVVKNNSREVLRITDSAYAYDSAGSIIGASYGEVIAVGPGCTSVLTVYFDVGGLSISSISDDINAKVEENYESVLQDLSYEMNVSGNKAIVSVSNLGSAPAEFVEAYALFFQNNSLVYMNSSYFTDDDSELKPGDMMREELTSYEDFDHVEVYLSGRR